MFLILALLVASASAYAYDMSRHNRSVVMHRLFQTSKPICAPKSPLSVKRHNHTRLPDGYRMPNSTSRPVTKSYPVPNKTVPAQPAPAPAPAPAPRSLRRQG